VSNGINRSDFIMTSIEGPGSCFNEICTQLYREEKYQDLSDLVSNLSCLYDKCIDRIGVEIGETRVLLGELYEKTKKVTQNKEQSTERANQARWQWTKAIDIFKEIGDQGWLAVALSGLGENQLDRSEWSDAEKNFREVLQILQIKFPKCELDLANAKRSLGNALWESGKGIEAVETYEEALRVYRELGRSPEQGIVQDKLELMRRESKLRE
jgi:tetratricopeptide (TPR) repeat protein